MLDRAYERASEGQRIYQRAYAAGHQKNAFVHTRFGTIAYRRGNHDEALRAYEAALAIDTAEKGANHIDVGYGQLNIAETHVMLRQPERALAVLESAERILRPHLEGDAVLTAFLASVRGRALLGQGRPREAVPHLQAALSPLRAQGEGMAMERADVCWALVKSLDGIGRGGAQEARQLAHEALVIYDSQGPSVHSPKNAVRQWLEKTGRHPR